MKMVIKFLRRLNETRGFLTSKRVEIIEKSDARTRNSNFKWQLNRSDLLILLNQLDYSLSISMRWYWVDSVFGLIVNYHRKETLSS